MKHHFEFDATVRQDTGKGASRRLRRQGLIPAIIYGAEKTPEMINLDHNKIINASAHESFYASILTLKVGKQAEDVILKDIQRHPFKPRITHLDFQRVQANVALHVHVPIHFLNEDKCVGVKEGGIIHHLMNDVEIACLPKFLPEYLELDLLNLAIDQTLHLSDITLPEGVTLKDLQGDEPDNKAVVSIHVPKEVVEETDAPVAPETEVINEKPSEEDKDAKK